MVKIKNVRIISIGTSKGIIIPMDFIAHGDIDVDAEYNMTLDKNENSNKD